MQRLDDDEPKTCGGSNTRLVLGLVLLTLGAFLFADRLQLFPFSWNEYIFTWQTLLIVIGVISLSKSESRSTGLILILIGGFFLSTKILGYPYNFRYYFWPTLFVVLGLILVFHRRKKRTKHFKFSKTEKSDDYIEDVAIFGGSDQKITSQNFKGGEMTYIFGGSNIDLSDAELTPGTSVIEIFCLFGGVELTVPPHWRLKMKVSPIFGGFSDERRKLSQSTNDPNAPTLLIKGTVIFGGGEIKS